MAAFRRCEFRDRGGDRGGRRLFRHDHIGGKGRAVCNVFQKMMMSFSKLLNWNPLWLLPFGPGLPYRLMMSSIPKSGSHLLQSMLMNLREIKRSPVVLYPYRSISEYRTAIEKLAHNRFAWGHIGVNRETLQLVQKYEMRILVMVRDPRDVVVSFVNHVYRLKPHILREYYSSLADDHERLKAAVKGAPNGSYQRDPIIAEEGIYNMYTGFADIGTVCESYLAWTEYPKAHMVRFEDLIGAEGGGSRANQEEAVRGIIGFLGLTYSEKEVGMICRKAYNRKSPTFHQGKTGRWKDVFTGDLKILFKSLAGDSLIRLGYEKNNSW